MSSRIRALLMTLAAAMLLAACGGGDSRRTASATPVDARRATLAYSAELGFDPQTQQTDEYIALLAPRAVAGIFMPDGRLLTVSQLGQVGVVDIANGVYTSLFNIDAVYSAGEKGAMDLEIDPNFATNRYFYVYYSNGTTTSNNRLRISRFTFGPVGDDIRRSELMLWTNPATLSIADYHIGGSLKIGPDGKFYLTVGDGTVPENSQSLTTMHGKMLRINMDGSIPTDNPFYDGPNGNVDEIYAYGLRNTFRFSLDRTTGTFWLGDVGGNVDSTAYEEVNILQRGANYGWPLCEGPLGLPKSGAVCPAGIKGPLYSYPHVVGGSCCMNRSITGGFVYRGTRYPSVMQGVYLYGDYAAGTIEWLRPTADLSARLAGGSFKPANTPAVSPVWFSLGPDGHIYYISFGWGNSTLRRIRYTGTNTNQPPVITAASASPTSGPTPLAVQFQGAATDPDGDPISYSWNFGDGTPTSMSASPAHTYTVGGSYLARLTVTAGGLTATSAPINIVVGSPPTATITAPANNTRFSAGDTITLTGTGTSPETGPLPTSGLTWEVQFKHNDHSHPVISGTGSSLTLSIPTTGHGYEGDTSYLAVLTATDSLGRTGTASVTLLPNKVPVTVITNVPTNGTVSVDGVTQTLPFVIDTIRNFQHQLSVPASVCSGAVLWNFGSWSDGGARTHTYTVPAAAVTLTATYQQTTQSCQTGQDGYQVSGGQVTFEAEGYDGKLDQGGKTWSVDAVTTGGSGTYMVALENTGTRIDTAVTTTSPRLDYRVIFDAPGTYVVWLRSRAADDTDNSIYVGLDGVVGPTVTFKTYGVTDWSNAQEPTTQSSPVATLTVPSAGLHTVSVWMREDGYRIDKFVLTASSTFVPSGTGPAVSPRGYSGPSDTTPPTVATVSPANGATGVAVTVVPSISFSEPVTNVAGIALATAAGSPVAATAAVNGSTVTLTPAARLAPATQYRITVPTTVKDLSGNPLASVYTTSFTTDATPPTVATVSPANGATGVTTNVVATIGFSEPVANVSGISLAPAAGGSAVAATVTVNGSTVTVTPAAPLAAGTQYRLTVPTTVTDLAGNALATAFSSSFTTTAPTVLAYNESGGMVVFEAEGFDANVAVGGRSWTLQSGSMTALPNGGYTIESGALSSSPRMDYRLRFATAGTFRVWIRAKAGSTADNSLHVGLNGAPQGILAANKLKSQVWTNVSESGTPVSITVPSPGVHVFSIWMREDGFSVDRVVLTTNTGYTPSGSGPAVSSRN